MTHHMMGTGGINMPLNPNMGMVEQMRVSRMPGQVGPLRAQIRGMRPTSGMAAQQQPIMHGSGGGAGGHMYNQGTVSRKCLTPDVTSEVIWGPPLPGQQNDKCLLN